MFVIGHAFVMQRLTRINTLTEHSLLEQMTAKNSFIKTDKMLSYRRETKLPFCHNPRV